LPDRSQSFTGGAIGIRLNNQQYAFKSLTFNGCNTAIAISHVFTLTAQDITFLNCGTGIDMSGNGVAGSVTLLDSSANFVGTVISAYSTGHGEGSLIVENFVSTNSGPTVTDTNGGATLVSGSVANTWVMGNANPGNYQSGTYYTTNRAPALLDSAGKYFTMPIPQYEEYEISRFVNVKNQDVKGDGATDDTAAINAVLLANAGCKITFFPQGVYLVYDTIYVPPGSIIVGEAWSMISAKGSNFWDASNPHVMVRVGNAGEVGVAQISDMLFTTADVLNGAILLEVNMAGASAGDVGFWNTHFRVGGAVDSLVNTNCGGSNTDDCKATFLMLHVTATGSPYIENMWGWTADHSLDTSFNQVISTGRGALIQGTLATWLVGTAFEHATLSMVQGFQTNYLNDMTCLNHQTNGQTNSQTSRQTNVKPVVKRAVKPTVKLTVKPTVKPVCLQVTHTAQCHNELLNNDGFKIPPAKLNVHRMYDQCQEKKKRRKKKPEVGIRYVCQSNQRKKNDRALESPIPLWYSRLYGSSQTQTNFPFDTRLIPCVKQ
jgi:hypothetical protein